MIVELTTYRLRLRQWQGSDASDFAAMNANSEVMELMPEPLDARASAAFMRRLQEGIADDGWGLWALELRETGEWLGFVGLARVRFQAEFTPNVEVGWRLKRGAWGHGYATEAARRSLEIAFGDLRMPEVVSFTSLPNWRSIALMERIGMRRDSEFDHPNLEVGHPLRRHVLYRLNSDSGA